MSSLAAVNEQAILALDSIASRPWSLLAEEMHTFCCDLMATSLAFKAVLICSCKIDMCVLRPANESYGAWQALYSCTTTGDVIGSTSSY